MASMRLLGTPEIANGDARVELPANQAMLLAAHLAYRGEWVRRDELVALFWPDEADRTARHNLSQLIYHLRRHDWAVGIEAERSRLRWDLPTDARAFLGAVADGAWADAVAAYDGELLQGIDATAHPAYETWLVSERSRLQSALRDAVLGHAAHLVHGGDAGGAARHLETLLQRDPLAEDALQAYLRVAVAAGRRDRALAAYARFEGELAADLGVEPLEETQGMARVLRDGTAGRSGTVPAMDTGAATAADAEVRATVGTTVRSTPSVPTYATPFVGRGVEIEAVERLLALDDVRLVTITGPGGVGKTRLALRLAERLGSAFPDGTVIVPLAPVAAADAVAGTALEAAGWDAKRRQPLDALVERARDTRMLWIFDNFEHVLDASRVVRALIGAAPESRILVTSRTALRLRAEALFELAGLGYAPVVSVPQGGLDDAVQLFVQSARRVAPALRIDADAHAAIVRICRILEGLPLGIELAAAWARTFTPEEIARELEADIRLLDHAHADLPDRQHGLRAVFEHSWSLLTPRQRQVLARLSVFRGGFTRAAAERVAGASAHDLLALANASLATRTPAGRFLRHVAVHRYSEEKLRADAGDERDTRNLHAEAFADLVQAMHAEIVSGRQLGGLEAIEADFDNVRAAWSWAVASGRWDVIRRAVPGLARFLETRGRFAEGATLFSEAAEAVRHAPAGVSTTLSAVLRAHLSALAFRLGDYDVATASGRAALDDAEGEAPGSAGALAHLTLGNVALFRGDNPTAAEHYCTALGIRRADGDRMGEADLLNNLAVIAFREGRFVDARENHLRSLAIKREVGHQHGIAMSLSSLGSVALHLGDLDEAEAYLRESLALRIELQDRLGETTTMAVLGELALARGDLREAIRSWRESLHTKEELGDVAGGVRVRVWLGHALAVDGAEREGATHLAHAIRVAADHGLQPYVASGLAWSSVVIAGHDAELAKAVLHAVAAHPSTLAADRARVRAQLNAQLDVTRYVRAPSKAGEDGAGPANAHASDPDAATAVLRGDAQPSRGARDDGPREDLAALTDRVLHVLDVLASEGPTAIRPE